MAMSKYLAEHRTYSNIMDLLFRVKVTVVDFQSIKGGVNKR